MSKYCGQIVSQDATLPKCLERDQGAWDRMLVQIRHDRKTEARKEKAMLQAAARRLESERRAARTPEEAAREDFGAVDLIDGRLRVTGALKAPICWARVRACQVIPGRVYDGSRAEWYPLTNARQLLTVASEFRLWVDFTSAQLAAATLPAPVPDVTRLDARTLVANPGFSRKQLMKDALGNFRARWDPESRRWLITVPPSALPEILSRLESIGLQIDPQLQQAE